jgi:hypothetical protein
MRGVVAIESPPPILVSCDKYLITFFVLVHVWPDAHALYFPVTIDIPFSFMIF